MRGLYVGDGKKYENSMSKGKRVKYGPAFNQPVLVEFKEYIKPR